MIQPCVDLVPSILSPASLQGWPVAWESNPRCSKAACTGTGSPSSESLSRRIPGLTRFATRSSISWSTTVSGCTSSRSSSRHLFTSSIRVAGGELITEMVLRVGEIPSRVVVSATTSAIDGDFTVSEVVLAEASSPVSAIQDPDLRLRFTAVISRYPQAPTPPGWGPSRVL